jgi:hypothetical protein
MSDEVTNFLRSVEQLKEKREEEDEARSRELEEKILQDRKERQARRAGQLPSGCSLSRFLALGVVVFVAPAHQKTPSFWQLPDPMEACLQTPPRKKVKFLIIRASIANWVLVYHTRFCNSLPA